jgi:hypothetical protein
LCGVGDRGGFVGTLSDLESSRVFV